MTEQQNLLLSPLFRYGMPATSAAAIVAIAFLVVEDETVRIAMLSVATVEIVATPWVLKRAGRESATHE